jgi:predicted signal transduction protein with EAL and GGDEF domain
LERLEPLLRSADMALYAAKAQGRDRTVLDRPGILAAGEKSSNRGSDLSK